MSTGKLKAQYNRVRTSVALQANSMWTKTIGVNQDPQAGSNAVIEASLKAPVHGGRGREARRMAAQALIEEAGYEPAVTSFEGLVALARAQGSIGGSNRGSCKICGGMGHLTKQCKNHLSSHYERQPDCSTAPGLPLLTEDAEVSSLSDSDGQQSDSESSGSERKRKKRKRSERKKDGSRRHKREDRSKHAREGVRKKRSKDKGKNKRHKRRKTQAKGHSGSSSSE